MLEGWLTESEARIAQFADPAHHTYLDLYLGRADALHALGGEPVAVMAELAKAARCYATHGEMYLRRWPHSRVRQRRLAPLELALVSRERDVMGPIAAVMGAECMTLLADLAGEELSAEVRAITGGSLGDIPVGPGAALGALALLYWAALSALVTGDGHGFDAVRMQARVVLDAFELPGPGATERMRTVHAALAALKPTHEPAFVQAWVAHVVATEQETPGGLDRAALALGCAGAAAGITLTVPTGGVSGAAREAGTDATVARHVAYVDVLTSAEGAP